MISKFNQISKIFIEIDKVLKEKIDVYVIGGAVLLYQGLKPATKDIDIIVKNKEDFLELQNALLKIGFSKKKTGIEYKKMDLVYVLTREDFRIDLFLEKVCSKFSLSEAMIKRAYKIFSLNNLSVINCSNEDIFLFKTMTERPGDLDDCMALAGKSLNWEIIKGELLNQIKISGKDIWITWVGERLDLLEDTGINIPIMKDIDKLREEYFDFLEKTMNKNK